MIHNSYATGLILSRLVLAYNMKINRELALRGLLAGEMKNFVENKHQQL